MLLLFFILIILIILISINVIFNFIFLPFMTSNTYIMLLPITSRCINSTLIILDCRPLFSMDFYNNGNLLFPDSFLQQAAHEIAHTHCSKCNHNFMFRNIEHDILLKLRNKYNGNKESEYYKPTPNTLSSNTRNVLCYER